MRDLNWIIASNGPEPTRRPEPPAVTDRSARATIGYYAQLLASACMDAHRVEINDWVDEIIKLRGEVR